MEDKVRATIESEIRPALQSHGGDVELISVNEETGVVQVTLVGACGGCPMAQQTLRNGVERLLMQYVPEVKAVEAV